jgi:hypothetical protein
MAGIRIRATIKLQGENASLATPSIAIAVNTCITYLQLAGKPFKSSRRPVTASGRQIIGIHLDSPFEERKNRKLPIMTKAIPPPLGVGLKCELLEFGVSIAIF